jgi:hypothetical protein
MSKKFLWGLISLMLLTACSSDEPDGNKKQTDNVNVTTPELITLKSGVVVEKWNNSYLYQGDILLSEAQFKLLDETGSAFPEVTKEEFIQANKDTGIPVYPLTGMSAYPEKNNTKAVGRNPNQNMFWSMLRYTFHKDLSPYQRQRISDAISYIERLTNVRFYNATNEPVRDPQYGFDYPYVEFTPSDKNNSPVGRIGKKQVLNLVNFDRGTITHEICHALGLFHEQSRADRDSYVTVNYNNIKKEDHHNFNKETRNYYMIGGFDFNSIMLYGSYDFAIDRSKPTMTKKDGSTFTDNYSLSDMDRMFLNRFYLPYIARKDVCAQLDKVVYDGNNNPLSEAQRIDLERQLNQNRCSYPLRN